MRTKSLQNQNYEIIRDHILNSESSTLSPDLQEKLDRIISAAKLLDKNPVKKNVVKLHMAKFSDICLAMAYRDLEDAAKMFNTYHEFDWDLWQTWLLDDAVDNITKCRNSNNAQDRKTIAIEHANIKKFIGEKPQKTDDPLRNEKHQFYILVQLGKIVTKIDVNNLDKLPEGSLREITKALAAGNEITVTEAKKIMNS